MLSARGHVGRYAQSSSSARWQAVRRFRGGRLLPRLRKVFVGDYRADLLELLPRGSVGAEIGVWRGDFSSRLLRVVRPARLHLIDPWRFEGGADYEGAWYGGAIAKNQPDMDDVYESVRLRFAGEAESGVVVIHRGPSAQIGMEFDDAYFDWVYIDGNHLYEHVREDLEIFATKVKSGGLITGDDYGVRGWWEDGVKRAVDEFVARGTCEPEHLGRQFVLRKV
jgi:Methyltransferase domain